MSKKALLGGLLPLLTNPATMVIAAAGIVGISVYGILTDEEKQENGEGTVEDGSVQLPEQSDEEPFSIETTADEPAEAVEWTADQTVRSSVEEPCVIEIVEDINGETEPINTVSDVDQKKEMIRMAMSELGKMSAAARAKRKNNN